ncbi:DUF1499 domain-containing protein [Piscinibacter sp. XHJ-5]|uniref:DUF1499 domain-containing protein n=1 Tax=Piscinibacter sp. XHJ-5 TaxID=3037797 RepID=UPI00245308B5|nr:DUF1499 domain-containing protein [Piscinibacter sp. XHJ-5]
MPDPVAPAGRFVRLGPRLATAALVLAPACGLAMLLAGIGYRQQWWGVGAGIRTMMGATGGALAAALLAALAIVAGVRGSSRRTVVLAAIALVIAALVAAPPLAMARKSTRVPPIHDITTDTQDPPRFVAVVPLRAGAPNSLDYDPEVAAQQRMAYPDIAPAMLDVPPARALLLAEQAVRAMGWEIVTVSPHDLRIEATATTRLFGFKDDVVVRIRSAPQGSRVDLRSVSRVGRSDLGANAERVRAYLQTLHALGRGG